MELKRVILGRGRGRLSSSGPHIKGASLESSSTGPSRLAPMRHCFLCDEVRYSVAPVLGTPYLYITAVPRVGGSHADQLRDACHAVEEVFANEVDEVFANEAVKATLLRQTVFLDDMGQRQACRHTLHQFHGERLPATTFLPQHPLHQRNLTLEAWAILERADTDVEIVHRDETVTMVEHDGLRWFHGAQITPEATPHNVYDRSRSGFARMERMLAAHDVSFGQVLRTWLYLGDIVGMEDATQRYMELNRARTDAFEGIHFANGHTPAEVRGPVYPASTGIGTDDTDILMDVLALQTARKDIRVAPLENPGQTAAFDYAPVYSPKSPKFARAMAVATETSGIVFISGTASITDSESRFIGDIAAQTRQTLDNMEALITADNLARHGMPGLEGTLNDLSLARVYIKFAEHADAARDVCRSRFGDAPAVYTVADVCRPELLVEIEGVAILRPCE